MCLSTVIKVVGDQSEELCNHVSNVEVDGGKVTFVDIMGIRTEVEGTISSIDLVENKIYVAAS